MKNRISIKSLCKNYDGFALDNVTFDVPAGTVVGFIGENGAGKSSTIKALLGINGYDSGGIEIDGKPLHAIGNREKQRIGVVLDDISLPENLTLVQLGRVMKNIYSAWDGKKFAQYSASFGLPEDRPIKEFSKGMRTKAAIAAALSHNCDTLVLDEPTSGLDPVARDEIIDILYTFMEDENHAILISSHITSDLEKLCDYIVFIHEGRIILSGAKDELTERYAVVRCDRDELDKIDKAALVSVLSHAYGAEALVDKTKLTARIETERVNIEKLMLCFIKGAN